MLRFVPVQLTESCILLPVARYVSEDATAQQCQSRWFRTLDPNLKRGPWSAEEDARLQVAVAAYEHSWVEVAALIHGRNNEQCRDRWMDKLSPKIVKGKWTEEEDRTLLEAVAELGPRWRDVSQRLNRGRTDNMVRGSTFSIYSGLIQRNIRSAAQGTRCFGNAPPLRPSTCRTSSRSGHLQWTPPERKWVNCGSSRPVVAHSVHVAHSACRASKQ